jgi:hypothetical protein
LGALRRARGRGVGADHAHIRGERPSWPCATAA